MKRLSVIISYHTTPAQLEDSLVSLLENRPENCDILVIQNRPYDNPYELKEDEVRFIPCAEGTKFENKTVWECVRTGMNASDSPYVYLMPAGVEFQPEWVGTPLEILDKHQDLGAFFLDENLQNGGFFRRNLLQEYIAVENESQFPGETEGDCLNSFVALLQRDRWVCGLAEFEEVDSESDEFDDSGDSDKSGDSAEAGGFHEKNDVFESGACGKKGTFGAFGENRKNEGLGENRENNKCDENDERSDENHNENTKHEGVSGNLNGGSVADSAGTSEISQNHASLEPQECSKPSEPSEIQECSEPSKPSEIQECSELLEPSEPSETHEFPQIQVTLETSADTLDSNIIPNQSTAECPKKNTLSMSQNSVLCEENSRENGGLLERFCSFCRKIFSRNTRS